MEMLDQKEARSRVIKVISLWQPWAEAMRRGVKRNETRSWPTSYRGWLAIHAAKKPIDLSDDDFLDFARYWLGDLSKLSFGAVVCIVRLTGCVRTETVLENLSEHEELWGNYDENRWAWQTDSLIQLPNGAIPLRGHQGLFEWQMPEEIAELTISKATGE